MEFAAAREAEILKEADELFYRVLWKPFGIPNVRGQFQKGGQEELFVAQDGGLVIGAFLLVVYSDNTAELRHAAVVPEYTGQKVGTGLWQQVLHFAKTAQISKIEVYARNTALGFWGHVGFRQVSDWLDHDSFVNHGIRFKRMVFSAGS